MSGLQERMKKVTGEQAEKVNMKGDPIPPLPVVPIEVMKQVVPAAAKPPETIQEGSKMKLTPFNGFDWVHALQTAALLLGLLGVHISIDSSSPLGHLLPAPPAPAAVVTPAVGQ